jgi:hypothetical protein
MPAWLWFLLGAAVWLAATLWFAWAMLMPKDAAELDDWDDDYWPTDNPMPPPPDVPVQAKRPDGRVTYFDESGPVDPKVWDYVVDRAQRFDPMQKPEKRKSFY